MLPSSRKPKKQVLDLLFDSAPSHNSGSGNHIADRIRVGNIHSSGFRVHKRRNPKDRPKAIPQTIRT